MTKIRCESCSEPIEADASTCPHCGDKKWTKNRTILYLVLVVPIPAMLGALLLGEAFVNANPTMAANGNLVLAGLLVILYAIGAVITWDNYTSFRARRDGSDATLDN